MKRWSTNSSALFAAVLGLCTLMSSAAPPPGGTRSTGDVAGGVSGSCQGDLDGANDRPNGPGPLREQCSFGAQEYASPSGQRICARR